jgi:PilZ domain
MASVCEPLVHAEAGDREEWIGLERRESERFRCNWYPTVSFLARARTLLAGRGVIRDVSRTGIALISEQILEPGTLLAIQLRSQQHGYSDVLSARIVRVVHQDDGSCLLGCRLSRSLSNDELAALLM